MRAAGGQRAALSVARIGYLVPTCECVGIVHSVFARACNVRVDEQLLSIVRHDAADGPTTLRLDRHAPRDLATAFAVGDLVRFDGVHGRSRAANIALRAATTWSPDPPRPPCTPERVACNVERSAAALARCRERRSSMLEREGSGVIAALERAYAELDAEAAVHAVERLIGWGEGLTPAGDDFLIGWCATATAVAPTDARAIDFERCIATTIEHSVSRTTPIAAHGLRLAASGHFGAHVHAFRDALVCGQDQVTLSRSLERLLATGATSGADAVAGLVSRAMAWVRGRVEQ